MKYGHQKYNTLKIILLFGLLVVLGACDRNVVYSTYIDLPPTGWMKDSVYTFEIDVTDTAATYELDLLLRNTDSFESQNLWLFITRLQNGQPWKCDTLNIFIADEMGQWLGSGVGNIHNITVPYKGQLRFAAAGTYTYSIAHAMRCDTLQGITHVGLQLLRLDE